MSDKEIFRKMLERAKIRCVKDGEYPGFPSTPDTFIIEGGYNRFISIISFNADGSLKTIEAYED